MQKKIDIGPRNGRSAFDYLWDFHTALIKADEEEILRLRSERESRPLTPEPQPASPPVA